MDYLNPDELLKLLEKARSTSIRDWCMILTQFSHGLRCRELVTLSLDQIKNNQLSLQRLKGSRFTCQPLRQHRGRPLLNEQSAMKEWLKIRPTGAGNFLFPTQKSSHMAPQHYARLFREYATECGLPQQKRHNHVLKHTCATIMIQNGADLAAVQVYLGHESINSTTIYAHLHDEQAAQAANDAMMQAF